MISVLDSTLDCNKSLKINFNGGDLSSDAGLILFKEFFHKIGLEKLLKNKFKTHDKA
ncbi:transposase, partial [Oribacterium sp. NK2B42]|uniref:transposase n=1 Tax=Oribacterium sp. NK2B42 TaxID=689781 RepID=UPI0018DE70E4